MLLNEFCLCRCDICYTVVFVFAPLNELIIFFVVFNLVVSLICESQQGFQKWEVQLASFPQTFYGLPYFFSSMVFWSKLVFATYKTALSTSHPWPERSSSLNVFLIYCVRFYEFLWDCYYEMVLLIFLLLHHRFAVECLLYNEGLSRPEIGRTELWMSWLFLAFRIIRSDTVS